MLCAYFSRVRGRGGVWFARFLVGFSGGLVWVSVAVSAVVVGGLSVVVLVGVWCGGVGCVGGCTRSRSLAHGLRIAEKPRTAHGLRVSACLPLVSVSAVVSVRQILSF